MSVTHDIKRCETPMQKLQEIIYYLDIQKVLFWQDFLFFNGFDVKAISEHLGHCNTAITSDIYTHIFKEYKAKMAESIEKDLI